MASRSALPTPYVSELQQRPMSVACRAGGAAGRDSRAPPSTSRSSSNRRPQPGVGGPGAPRQAGGANRTSDGGALKARQEQLTPAQQQQQGAAAKVTAPQQRNAAANPRAPGAAPSEKGSGYSAGDNPDARKNKELYSGLNQAPSSAPSSDGDENTPTVTYMLSTASSSSAVPGVPLPHKPEILAPAGGWPQLKAAVENGADAVYFGTSDFNARARAANFTPEELPEVMTYLHDRGVKGYVALNVLVFDEELPAVEARVRDMAAARVDAVIVQDLGVVELMRRSAPGLPVHGSTQMSITSAQGAQFAAGLGVGRVVVGRELSVREIGKVRAGTGAEVEAFVHGALCVSYSGQCFSSEAWGGRSANRGQCAQACRMPYGLMVDGQLALEGDASYVLSPQDLMAVEQVPDLIAAGVSCFKIEGRLKGPEYVALTTQTYRRAVDRAWDALLQHAAGGAAAAAAGGGAAAAGGVPLQAGEEEEGRWAGGSEPPHAAAAPSTASASASSSGASSSSGSSGSSAGAGAGAAAAGAQLSAAAMDAARRAVALPPSALTDLAQVFARGQDGAHTGLTPGFLQGVKHQRLVRGRAPRHRGVYLGEVLGVIPAPPGPSYSGAPSSSGAGSYSSGPGPGAASGARGSGGGGYGASSSSGSSSSSSFNGSSSGGGSGGKAEGIVVVRLAAPIKRGHGVVFDQGRPEEEEQGGSVFDVYSVAASRGGGGGGGGAGSSAAYAVTGSLSARGDSHEVGAGQVVGLAFGQGQVDARAVQPGHIVWRTKDAGLESRLRGSWDGLASAAQRKLPVEVVARGALGQPFQLLLRAAGGVEVSASSSMPLQPASKRPMSREDVEAGVGMLGDNALSTSALDLSGLALDQGLFLPASELKSLRRRAVERLVHVLRDEKYASWLEGLSEPPVLPSLLAAIRERPPASAAPTAPSAARGGGSSTGAGEGEASASGRGATAPAPAVAGKGPRAYPNAAPGAELVTIRVLCRTREQAEAALTVPWLTEVVLDFLEVHGLKEAVQMVQGAGRRAVVATPRVLKPDEERLWLFYLRLGADALLLRSAGMLQQLMGLGGPGARAPACPDHPIPPLEGDFSLNAANVISADLLLRSGLSRLAPTYDLHAGQMSALARGLGPARSGQLEAVVHQHLPIFHTEHCVFARFLSTGNSYVDCGHPCESHSVRLRDEQGGQHLVLADMGCRNTVFNAQAQSGLFYLRDLVKGGYHCLRLELVDEQPAHVPALLEGYREVLLGQRGPGDMWRWLGALPGATGYVAGISAGSLQVHTERAAATLRPTAAENRSRQQAGAGAGPAPRRAGGDEWAP